MNKIILNKQTRFIHELQAYSGAKIAARNVMHDMELIFGETVKDYRSGEKVDSAIIYGTVGSSPILDKLDAEGKIDVGGIRGKWEAYSIAVVAEPIDGVSTAVVVAGSDKRGTIYGLYYLSELMGVSPLVNWNHVYPEKRDEIVFTDEINMASKTPSVKYRGFFINDE